MVSESNGSPLLSLSLSLKIRGERGRWGSILYYMCVVRVMELVIAC